jgi:hypothetical protein
MNGKLKFATKKIQTKYTKYYVSILEKPRKTAKKRLSNGAVEK